MQDGSLPAPGGDDELVPGQARHPATMAGHHTASLGPFYIPQLDLGLEVILDNLSQGICLRILNIISQEICLKLPDDLSHEICSGILDNTSQVIR